MIPILWDGSFVAGPPDFDIKKYNILHYVSGQYSLVPGARDRIPPSCWAPWPAPAPSGTRAWLRPGTASVSCTQSPLLLRIDGWTSLLLNCSCFHCFWLIIVLVIVHVFIHKAGLICHMNVSCPKKELCVSTQYKFNNHGANKCYVSRNK